MMTQLHNNSVLMSLGGHFFYRCTSAPKSQIRLLSKASSPVVRPIQPPYQWILGLFLGCKAPEAWSWSFTSI